MKVEFDRLDQDTEVYHYGRECKIQSIKKTTDQARPGVVAYSIVLVYVAGGKQVERKKKG